MSGQIRENVFRFLDNFRLRLRIHKKSPEAYAIIMDASISVGDQQMLLALKVPADHTGKALTHADEEVVGMAVSENWPAAKVKEFCEEITQEQGHKPEYYITDNGKNLSKAITGESSVINRLKESIGQCNHIILNMATNYDSRRLSRDIKQYFSLNPNAAEVMVFKGGRQIVVKRNFALNPNFIRDFMMRYNKRKSR